MKVERNYKLKIVNNSTLNLYDEKDNLIATHKPYRTNFNQCKRIKEDFNIIKEDDEGFTKDNEGKANIYCLDDNFNLVWIIGAPFQNDSFPNEIMWNKQTVRIQRGDGYLALDVIDNPNTFICSSWSGHTVTVDYKTGKTISREFTK